MTAPISGVQPISIPEIAKPAVSSGQPGQFQQVLSGAIQSLETANNNASDSVRKFLTGENEDLHSTILATQQAQLAFELGLQVRNKVVDAYQEVMKMQM